MTYRFKSFLTFYASLAARDRLASLRGDDILAVYTLPPLASLQACLFASKSMLRYLRLQELLIVFLGHIHLIWHGTSPEPLTAVHYPDTTYPATPS